MYSCGCRRSCGDLADVVVVVVIVCAAFGIDECKAAVVAADVAVEAFACLHLSLLNDSRSLLGCLSVEVAFAGL